VAVVQLVEELTHNLSLWVQIQPLLLPDGNSGEKKIFLQVSQLKLCMFEEQLTHDPEFMGLNTAIAGIGIKLKKEKIKFLVLVQ
jgi:hypothetical protein